MLSNGEFFRDGEKRKEEAEVKKKKRVGELFHDIFKYNKYKKTLSLLLVLILSVGFVLSGNFDFSLTAVETGVSVRYYVAENNDWKLVQSKTTVAGKTTNWNGTGSARYYASISELEEIYAAYGFFAADFNGERIFPHTDSHDPNRIWADAAPAVINGEYCIPLSSRTTIYVYYMPANVPGNATYFTTNTPKNNTAVLQANSFYTCKVFDPEGLVYPNEADVPSVLPVFNGDAVSVTVKTAPGVNWKVFSSADGSEVDFVFADNGDGTATLSVQKMSCPITVSTGAYDPTAHLIRYNAATLADNLVTLGRFSPDQQSIVTDGSIRGKGTLSVYTGGVDSHTVVSPDSDLAVTSFGTVSEKFLYTFVGWSVEGKTDVLLSPGDVLTQAQMDAYAVDGELRLNAVWNATDIKGRVNTCNFFVNINCEIMDNMSNGFQSNPTYNFSKSVYATRVYGTDEIAGSSSTNVQIIAPPTASDTAYEVDGQLRKLINTPIQGITLEAFPSDENVLAALRAGGITITVDGKTYTGDELTSENFSVRWYVLKYENSDGWHIDGVLVAKSARVTVKKTFGGDDDAVALIKNGGYKITVTHKEENTTAVDYTLCLEPLGQETVAGTTGYKSYDEATQTYLWSLAARQGREYLFREENYLLTDGIKWNNSNSYMITNSTENGTNGWVTYNTASVVKCVAQAYPNDVPDSAVQTVAFRNIYVQAGLLSVTKIDSVTSHGMKDVAFKISRVDGTPMELYKKTDKSQYSADTNAPADGYTEYIADDTVRTDNSGSFYIKLPVGSYYLEETAPTGYDCAKKLLVEVTDNGIVRIATTVIGGDVEPEGGWVDGVGTAVLTVRNRSKLLTLVRAEKDWGNTPEEQRLPVKIELYRNGARMTGDIYAQTLSNENGWAYEWKNLPLYIDGEVAVYTLRETFIGENAYDPSVDEDGYIDYLVSSDPALYREGTLSEYGPAAVWADSSGKLHFADHCLLRIHNKPSSGEIAFTKTDSFGTPLAGAEFTLYADEGCTVVLEKVVSAEGSGFVIFSPRTFGTYYIKETRVPDGYIADTSVYSALIRGGICTITRVGGDGTPVRKIENRALMSLTVKKVNSVGDLLAGAEFRILKNEQLYGTFSTGEDGTYHLSNMPDGEYRIVETKAPEGYKERPDFAVLNILAGKVTVTSANTQGWSLSDDGNGAYTLTVVNDVIYDLPTVGGSGIYGFVLAGAGLMLFATAAVVIYAVISKRKKK